MHAMDIEASALSKQASSIELATISWNIKQTLSLVPNIALYAWGEEPNHHINRVWWLKAIKILTIRFWIGLGDMTFSLVAALLKTLFSWDLFHLSDFFKSKKHPLFPRPTNCRHWYMGNQPLCFTSIINAFFLRRKELTSDFNPLQCIYIYIYSRSRSWMSRSTASNKLTSHVHSCHLDSSLCHLHQWDIRKLHA